MGNQLTQYVIDTKKKYFSVNHLHITVISDDLIIPWKPLSIGDYIFYSKEIREGRFPLSIFEDEIFHKCVLDQSIIRQLPFLKAGIITTTVENIWNNSCANSVDELNGSLEEARQEVNSIAPAIHELVSTILFAFPAYKPEEVYSMDYQSLMRRAIDAETKLLQSQIIKEPIKFEPKEEEEQQKIDPKQLWDKQQQNKELPPRKKRRGIDNLFKDLQKQKQSSSSLGKKKSPIIEALDKGLPPVVDSKETENSVFHGSGHDIIDRDIITHQMVEEAKVLYADVIEDLRKRRKGK